MSAATLLAAAGCTPDPGGNADVKSNKAVEPSAGSAGTIRMLVWSGLMAPIVKESAVSKFKAKYPKVDVQLEQGTNAELYPKLLATRSDTPYVGGMMNDLFTARGVLDDMWQKPDPALMPSAAKVPTELNPDDGYGYTFMLTGLGIAYNPDKVKEPPKSWTDLYRPEYKGRVVMSDGYFGAYQMAALAEGKKVDDIQAGIDIWKKYRANIGSFTNGEGQKDELIARGDMWAGPAFGSWTQQAKSTGKSIEFCVPEEGLLQWVGALQVIKGVSGVDVGLGAAFFDQFYTTEFQQQLVSKGFFIPAVPGVDIPADIAKTVPAVMTADEAVDELITYDVKAAAKGQRKYTAEIQRTLK